MTVSCSSSHPLADISDRLNQLWFDGNDKTALTRARYDLWFNEPCDEFRASLVNFADAAEKAISGSWEKICDNASKALSLMLLLDQIPHYLYPHHIQTYEASRLARGTSRRFLARAFDLSLPPVARWFFYLPFSYSESRADQECALSLFASLPTQSPHYADIRAQVKSRYDLILHFGRFPQRNTVLGRSNTPEEADFLASL